METLTNEIKNCLLNKLWYAALVLTLTLPDICAALESEDGVTSSRRYKEWFTKWVLPKYPPDLLIADENLLSAMRSCPTRQVQPSEGRVCQDFLDQ